MLWEFLPSYIVSFTTVETFSIHLSVTVLGKNHKALIPVKLFIAKKKNQIFLCN